MHTLEGMQKDKLTTEKIVVSPPKEVVKRRTVLRKKISIVNGLLLVSVLLIGFSGYNLLIKQQKTSGVVQLEPSTAIITEDVQEPEEKRPDMTQEYSVPAEQPRSIIIPSIGTDGFVQKVGLTSKNAVAVPNNIHVAGWYINSVVPGAEGLSIIDGHVSGKYENGVFYYLKKLKKGDVFQIEFGDKSLKTFEVVDTKQMAESESAEFLFEKNNEIREQLNLITCGGNFNKDSQQFADRVVVVSRLVQ